jgi:hypothetical protein
MILWGDLHNHCGISYGFGSLHNALKIARAHLDFCAITGHAMWPDIYKRNEDTAYIIDFHEAGFKKLERTWDKVRDTIARHNGQDLVTFQSYEMHSRFYGDHHIISPDDSLPLIYRDSPKELVRGLGCEAIAVAHHIGYTPGYRGINWEHYDEEITPCIEVFSKHGCAMSAASPYGYYHNMGPRDPRNTVYEGLKRGNRFSFLGSTDHHAGFPGSYGDGLTAVIAENKSREAIWQALKAGRAYAVTGDRIACDFTINTQPLGSCVHSAHRRIKLNVSAEDAIDKIIIYKNLKPLHVYCPESAVKKQPLKYKLRVETGWGYSEALYKWECSVEAREGSITGANAYFRGRSVLSPTEKSEKSEDDINNIDVRIAESTPSSFRWVCETVKNKTTLHPQTDSAVIEIQGDDDTLLTITVNGITRTNTVRELLECGYSAHMKPYASHAYLVHTMVPECDYTANIELDDSPSEKETDVYHAEIAQKNNQWAFISPIYAKAGGRGQS